MSLHDWLVVIGIITTPITLLIIAGIRHIKHDERREVRLASIEREIGTRGTGIRGDVHEHTNALVWLGGCIWFIANKLGIDLPRREK